jgi:hypothetical protein
MKSLKYIGLGIIVCIVCYAISYKSKTLNIEGTWVAEEIILDAEPYYRRSTYDPYLQELRIIINNWSDSISIPNGNKFLFAKYKIVNNNQKISLTSLTAALNGVFNIEIDTIFSSSREYKIFLKFEKDKTAIHLYRDVIIKPIKPRGIGQRGRP